MPKDSRSDLVHHVKGSACPGIGIESLSIDIVSPLLVIWTSRGSGDAIEGFGEQLARGWILRFD